MSEAEPVLCAASHPLTESEDLSLREQKKAAQIELPALATLQGLKLRIQRLIEASILAYKDAPTELTAFDVANLYQWLHQLEALPKFSNWPAALATFGEGIDKMESGEQVILQQATADEIAGARVASDPLEASFNRVMGLLERLARDISRDIREGLDTATFQMRDATVRQWVQDCYRQVEQDYGQQWRSYASCRMTIAFLQNVKHFLPPDETAPTANSKLLKSWAEQLWHHVGELETHCKQDRADGSVSKALDALAELGTVIGEKADEFRSNPEADQAPDSE